MQMHEERAVRNVHGERIDYTFHAGSAAQGDLVVLGHGVTGNKDRAFLVTLAEALAAAGFAALRMSFSGNGGSEGRFEDSTISKEIQDLGSVLDAVAPDAQRIAFVGHSMGGAVGVGRAATDDRISALVSLAGMVHVQEFCERKFGAQTPGDSSMWGLEGCPLSRAYVDDMARLDTMLSAASSIRCPWLLVHGLADTVVLPKDSKDAMSKAQNGELVELDGVDHVFSGDGTGRMVDVVVPWFRRVWGTLA